MTYTPFTPIAIGSLAWGTPLNAAIVAHDKLFNSVAPPDHEMIAWNFPVTTLVASSAMVSGTVQMQKIWLRQPETITNVAAAIGTAGSGLTASQNFGGVYDSAGNRLGVTADQTANWGTAGFKLMALTAPVAVAAGAYYVALLSNGTTPPTLARSGMITASIANANLTATNGAFTTGPAAQTSLPVSITMASRTLSAAPTWSGVS